MIKAIPPLSEAELDEAFDRALSNGVTEVHDMGAITIGADALAVFRRAHDQGRRKLRVRAYGPLAQWAVRRDFVAEHGKGDDRLKWDGLRGFLSTARSDRRPRGSSIRSRTSRIRRASR